MLSYQGCTLSAGGHSTGPRGARICARQRNLFSQGLGVPNMKLSKLAFAAAVAWGICVGSATAQVETSVPARQATFESYYYSGASAGQISPSDKAAAPAAQAPAYQPSCQIPASSGCDTGCNDCCGSHLGDWLSCWPCGCKLEDLGEAHKLWQPCCEDSPWTAGGWLAQSYTWNPYQPNDNFNGPVTWTDRANEYQMNELYGFLGRAANTEGCGWDWGFRTDAMYGTNYRWN